MARQTSHQDGRRLRPLRSVTAVRLFGRYVDRYLSRHFHGLRLSRATPPPGREDEPLVLYLNHASWWDPLVGLELGLRLFGDRPQAAVIDARALGRYRILERLGFVGIERGSKKGARRFLSAAERVLATPRGTLWLTPQGTFVDARVRPVRFAPGIGHLARRLERGALVPVAVEYVFREERLPEILVRFGEALEAGELRGRSPVAIANVLAGRLEETQDALAAEAQRRDPRDFDDLLAGRAGVGGIYDLWRRARALVRGERFVPEHRTSTEIGGGA